MDLALPREYAGETMGTHSALQDRIADLEKELLANEEKYEETWKYFANRFGFCFSPECPRTIEILPWATMYRCIKRRDGKRIKRMHNFVSAFL